MIRNFNKINIAFSIFLIISSEILICACAKQKDEDIFVATHEWQVIKDGVKIPKGLHVRINLETGLKEAKLLDSSPEDKNKNNALLPLKPVEKPTEEPESEPKYSPDELKQLLKNIKDENNESTEKKKLRNYAQLKKELGDLNLSVKSDSEVLVGLLQEYKELNLNKEIDENEKNLKTLNILQDIEYIVHQIDNAENFVKLNGFHNIVYSNLNNTNLLVKCEALNIFGVTMQNNKKAQISAFETGAYEKLLKVLALDNKEEVKLRGLFSLASLLRHFPLAQKHFIQHGGVDIISNLFEKSNNKINLKIITLFHDLLIEQKTDQNLVDLKSKLIELKWCDLLNNYLNNHLLIDSNDHDTVEKFLSFMSLIIDECATVFNNTNLKSTLQKLNQNYEALSDEEKKDTAENDIYFTTLKQLTETLLHIINNSIKFEL